MKFDEKPKKGLKGLALGIAIARGVPTAAGLISVIIGGTVTTFFRGSFAGINGPGN